MMPFDNGSYFWLKKSLKILAFSKKLVTSFSLTNNGGITGSLLPLTKFLSNIQYGFAELDGSDNLADKQRWSLSFEDLIDFTKSLWIHFNRL